MALYRDQLQALLASWSKLRVATNTTLPAVAGRARKVRAAVTSTGASHGK